jgi:hypothetical protein
MKEVVGANAKFYDILFLTHLQNIGDTQYNKNV